MRVRWMAAVVVLVSLGGAGFGLQGGQQGPGQSAPPPAAPSRPVPDSHGRYKVGNGVTPPKIIHSVDPRYTDDARRARLTGVSVLSLTVGTDGVPYDISVVGSIAEGKPNNLRSIAEGLDASAIKTVGQYRFKPSTLDGKPVPVEIRIEVNFQLF